MSLKITIVDEQTGETESMRVATGGFTVIAANPCAVDKYSEPTGDGNIVIKIKNFAPEPLPDVS